MCGDESGERRSCRWSSLNSSRDGPVSKKSKQQVGIDHHHDCGDTVCGEGGGEVQFDKDSGQSKGDDQGVEGNADPPECFRIHPTNEKAPERNSQQDTRNDIGNDLHAAGAIESDEIVGDSRQDRFPHSNDSQCSAEILFGISLIVEKERKGRARNGGDGI